jgi:hypothetical protein
MNWHRYELFLLWKPYTPGVYNWNQHGSSTSLSTEYCLVSGDALTAAHIRRALQTND